MQKLNEVAIENHSGFEPNLKGQIPVLRRTYFRKIDFWVGGDAPKDFLKVYSYEEGVLRNSKKTWPSYIAKVGHKWYPMESITEHLMTRIGQVLGVTMADSRLMMANNQLRFLSRYFLKKNENLVHGAQIFAGYLEDEKMAEEIEEKDMARELFTFQFAESAIKAMFPKTGEQIVREFVKMLVFDAVIGNNDRHFYNWGVIVHTTKSKILPKFAPVYDTARGLLWNHSEAKLVKHLRTDKEAYDYLANYGQKSQPKTGWEGVKDITHYTLIEKIFTLDHRYRNECVQLLEKENLEKVYMVIDEEFSQLMSTLRRNAIKRYIELRFNTLSTIIKNGES